MSAQDIDALFRKIDSLTERVQELAVVVAGLHKAVQIQWGLMGGVGAIATALIIKALLG